MEKMYGQYEKNISNTNLEGENCIRWKVLVGRIYIANITCLTSVPSLLVDILNSNYKGMYNVMLQVHSGMYIKIQLSVFCK